MPGIIELIVRMQLMNQFGGLFPFQPAGQGQFPEQVPIQNIIGLDVRRDDPERNRRAVEDLKARGQSLFAPRRIDPGVLRELAKNPNVLRLL